jgi:hypothetical protein
MKKFKEENGTCLEERLKITLEKKLEINLESTVCVRSLASWRRG